MTLGHVLLRIILFLPVSLIPPVLHIYLHIQSYSSQMDKWAKPGNFPVKALIFENGGASLFHFWESSSVGRQGPLPAGQCWFMADKIRELKRSCRICGDEQCDCEIFAFQRKYCRRIWPHDVGQQLCVHAYRVEPVECLCFGTINWGLVVRFVATAEIFLNYKSSTPVLGKVTETWS